MAGAGFSLLTALPTEWLARFGAHSTGETRVTGELAADAISLSNGLVTATWTTRDRVLRAHQITDTGARASLALPERAFEIVLADGSTLASTDMRITGVPRMESIAPRAGRGANADMVFTGARAADGIPGKRLTVTLEDPRKRLRAIWRAELRDGSRYVRQEVTLQPQGGPLPLKEIALVDMHAAGAQSTGTVRGSPVTIGNWYVGFEHPLSHTTVDGDHVRCTLPRDLPLRPESPVVLSSVVGTTRSGQMRRDFLEYVERERAHPYRTFLHYNTWYDIGYFSKYSEPEALAAIQAFGDQLVKQRGVVMDSVLFDDGWDDPKTLWGFHAGFPDGFTRVRAEAAKYGFAPGVWMSPWGGYGNPQKDRLTYGRAQGFETNEGGFALSGPKYYARFRDTCLHMMRDYGVNQFKFDGTGNASRAFPGSAFDSDFDAAIHLIQELRGEKPDLFVNLTTGTYPSPFWLRYADSIWRGGEDHSFAGVGSDRQQWITYRDGDIHEHVVKRGALYPLNSLMLHGMIYARHANKLDVDPHRDFTSEIQSYFGTGTQLQEMYITPVLTSGEWDTLAEAAKWSRANAATLRDTHWIGGDPKALEPYGFASWSAAGGIITLRNPSDRPQSFALDVGSALELPEEAARSYTATSPWQRDRGRPAVQLTAGQARSIALQPFEVVTMELRGA
jgi:hypothetical protein